MGNDIKLPVSQRSSLLESQRASDAEAKAQLNSEIERISEEVASITHRTDKLEYNLKQTSRNIGYYKTLIMDMAKTLQEIEVEQMNASLSHENHAMKASQYLKSLEEVEEKSDTESLADYDAEIARLEVTVAELQDTVANNEELIVKKATNNLT